MLDILGDRWVLLIIRELLLGPRRWSDLVADLPGIGKNLLSSQLSHLERLGLVSKQKLPWVSGRSSVYDLTQRGRQLEGLLVSMAHWGLFIPASSSEVSTRPAWAAISLWAAARPRSSTSVEIIIDGLGFTYTTRPGYASCRRGPNHRAAVRTKATTATVYRAALGRVGREMKAAARALGIPSRLHFHGDSGRLTQ